MSTSMYMAHIYSTFCPIISNEKIAQPVIFSLGRPNKNLIRNLWDPSDKSIEKGDD